MNRSALVLCLLASLLFSSVAFAQDTTTEELLERIKKLENEVRSLQGADEGAEPEEDDGFRFDPEFGDEDEPEEDEHEEEGSPLQLHLPLSMKLTFTGSIRARTEYRSPNDYRIPGTLGRPATDEPDDDTDFTLLRTRIGFTLDVTESLRAIVEIQDSRTFGDIGVATDRGDFHLYQGFLDIHDPFGIPLDIWIGRWEVPRFGDARLIAEGPFNNVGRSWDGVEVIYRPKGFKIIGFVANVREGQNFSADGDANDDFTIAGLYTSIRMIEDFQFDTYVLWRHLSDRVFTSELGRVGDRKDFTFGARIKGGVGPLGFTGEAMWQEGDQAGDRISTYAGAARAWLKLDLGDDMWLTFTGEYAYAKGDRDPLDGKEETFDPLIGGRRHFYYGRADLISLKNIHSVMFGTKFSPMENLSFHADALAFFLDKRKDAWYRANLSAVRIDPTGGSSSHVGSELDVYARVTVWEHLKVHMGYAHFFDGEFVRDTGFSTDQGWFNLEVMLEF